MEESISQSKVAFFCNLPYGNTVWGKFYANYKSLKFNNLRHRLNAEGRKMHIMREHIARHPEDKFQEMQKVFKGTGPDGKTPKELLLCLHTAASTQRGGMRMMKQSFGSEVYREYNYRHRKEYNEILAYYLEQKEQNEQRIANAEQAEKTRRNGRAAEKIQCERCMQIISRGGKSAHMKTKKCIESTNP